jgi:hypothetical protein
MIVGKVGVHFRGGRLDMRKSLFVLAGTKDVYLGTCQPSDKIYTLKNIGGNIISVYPKAGSTIEGSTTAELLAGESVSIFYWNREWHII